MNVAILGSGPAGLLAAHAAEQRGHRATIYSNAEEPSTITGAQYLHESIPGVTDQYASYVVRYIKRGTRDGYAKKVYGSEDAPVSWDDFDSGDHHAYPLRTAYEDLWQRFRARVTRRLIRPTDPGWLTTDHDLVLSSVPAPFLCLRPDHRFDSQEVWIRVEHNGLPHNTIIYNGDESDPWYRASSLWGHESVEYSRPVVESLYGAKPVHTNCRCHLQLRNFIRIGRFGKWKKGELVSGAYTDAVSAMMEAENAL